MTDLTIPSSGASVRWSGKRDTGRAGASITPPMPLYADASDNNDLKPADADMLATSIFVGFALNAAEDGQPVEYGYGEGTLTIGGTGVSVGATYVVSTNAGGIAPEADLSNGDFVTFLGIGATTSTIKCAPFSSQVEHG